MTPGEPDYYHCEDLLSEPEKQVRDEGRARHWHISTAKTNNASEALKIARAARDTCGANRISLGYPVIRHMLDLKTVIPSCHQRRNIAGRQLLTSFIPASGIHLPYCQQGKQPPVKWIPEAGMT